MGRSSTQSCTTTLTARSPPTLSPYPRPTPCPVLPQPLVLTSPLCAYAKPGTESGYGAMRSPVRRAYGATRSLVLRAGICYQVLNSLALHFLQGQDGTCDTTLPGISSIWHSYKSSGAKNESELASTDLPTSRQAFAVLMAKSWKISLYLTAPRSWHMRIECVGARHGGCERMNCACDQMQPAVSVIASAMACCVNSALHELEHITATVIA
eukprot:1383772-Rhodomonas_salina.2